MEPRFCSWTVSEQVVPFTFDSEIADICVWSIDTGFSCWLTDEANLCSSIRHILPWSEQADLRKCVKYYNSKSVFTWSLCWSTYLIKEFETGENKNQKGLREFTTIHMFTPNAGSEWGRWVD